MRRAAVINKSAAFSSSCLSDVLRKQRIPEALKSESDHVAVRLPDQDLQEQQFAHRHGRSRLHARRYAVFNQPAQRLQRILASPVQHLGLILLTIKKPQARAQRPCEILIAPPSTATCTRSRQHIICSSAAIREKRNQNRCLEPGIRLQISTHDDAITRRRYVIPYGCDIHHITTLGPSVGPFSTFFSLCVCVLYLLRIALIATPPTPTALTPSLISPVQPSSGVSAMTMAEALSLISGASCWISCAAITLTTGADTSIPARFRWTYWPRSSKSATSPATSCSR